MSRKRALSRCLLSALVLVSLLWSMPAEGATGRTTTTVAGGWTSLINCAFTAFDPATGKFACTGSTLWDGAWTGITHYTASGVFNLTTGDVRGSIDEVFTGVYTTDHSMGTLTFHESFTIDGATNAILITANITGSSGDATFGCSKGRVTFDGIDTPATGLGGYEGKWVHGCVKRK